MVDYETIRKRHGGDNTPPRMFVHRGRQILALCLTAEEHPRIHAHPPEVWIRESENTAEWSDRLAYDTGALLLYVGSAPGSDYRSRGVYHVLGSSDDPVELACRTAYAKAERLARIVFLSGPHWR